MLIRDEPTYKHSLLCGLVPYAYRSVMFLVGVSLLPSASSAGMPASSQWPQAFSYAP